MKFKSIHKKERCSHDQKIQVRPALIPEYPCGLIEGLSEVNKLRFCPPYKPGVLNDQNQCTTIGDHGQKVKRWGSRSAEPDKIRIDIGKIKFSQLPTREPVFESVVCK